MTLHAYKTYLVVVLMAILAFSYVDRMVFGIVLEYIKADLNLTDTQMGFVGGIGFALFFAVMGIPIARWGDRGDRVVIISLTTAVWSVAVALCGMAASSLQLFLVRIGVAAGEAGCTPLASSLIPDYFSRAERPRAAARYYLGPSIGLTIGYFAGGWLNQLYGWRATFIIVGLPGLALAALAALTLKEPRRLKNKLRMEPSASMPNKAIHASLTQVAVTLWRNTTFRHLLIVFMAWYFSGWAIQGWLPAFFIRSHRLATGELGTWLAVAYGSSGLVGTWLGGEWGSRFAPGNEYRQLIVAAGLFVFEGLAYAGAIAAPNHYLALGSVTLANLAEAMAIGPIFATTQTLVPAHMRATALAVVSLFPSVVGAGLGPLAAGAMSDLFHPWVGEQSLRYALLILCPGYGWAAWHLWRASQTVTRDVTSANADLATNLDGPEACLASE